MKRVEERLQPVARFMKLGVFGRNTVFSTLGLLLRSTIQAVYLIMLSRWMGVSDYGLFSGYVAIALVLSPLSGWGIMVLVTRQLSKERARGREILAAALLQVFLTGGLLLGLFWLIADHFMLLQGALSTLFLLAISELVLLPISILLINICLAYEKGGMASVAMCLIPVSRLCSVVAGFLVFNVDSVDGLALFHFLGSLSGALIAIFIAIGIVGRPIWTTAAISLRRNVAEGGKYGVGSLLNSGYLEVDKVLIIQLLSAEALGAYNVAFRVASIFLLPISALLGVFLPRLFVSSSDAVAGKSFKTVFFLSMSYGAVAAAVIAVASFFMKDIFGADFHQSQTIMLLFAGWPLFFAFHQFFGCLLTGRELQRQRLSVEFGGFFIVIMANLALLPHYGVSASIASLYAAEFFMGLGCWVMWRRALS